MDFKFRDIVKIKALSLNGQIEGVFNRKSGHNYLVSYKRNNNKILLFFKHNEIELINDSNNKLGHPLTKIFI